MMPLISRSPNLTTFMHILGWIGCIGVCCSKILVTTKVDLVFYLSTIIFWGLLMSLVIHWIISGAFPT